METNELIKSLAKQAKPVKRLRPVSARFMAWFGLALFGFAIGVVLHGLRADLSVKLSQTSFLLECVVLLLVATTSSYLAFKLSVPGSGFAARNHLIPLLSVAIWFVILGYRLIDACSAQGMAALSCSLGFVCVRNTVVLAWLPIVLLLVMVRRAAPLHFGLSGLFILLSGGALAALGTQLVCSSDQPMHVLIWHFLPVAFIAGLGFFLGKNLLRW